MDLTAEYKRLQKKYPVKDTVGDLNNYMTYLLYAWYKCLDFARAQVPTLPILRLRIGCPLLTERREKGRDPRAMAHTAHYRNTVCIHPSLSLMPRNFIWGILIHEIGHNIDNVSRIIEDDDNQFRADSSVARVLGIDIHYDNPWMMEWITDEDIRKILEGTP